MGLYLSTPLSLSWFSGNGKYKAFYLKVNFFIRKEGRERERGGGRERGRKKEREKERKEGRKERKKRVKEKDRRGRNESCSMKLPAPQ